MPTFLLLSVLAFVLFPHLDVLGTFPSPMCVSFLLLGKRHTSRIFSSTPSTGIKTCLLVVPSFFALPCFLSLCFLVCFLPCFLSLCFFVFLSSASYECFPTTCLVFWLVQVPLFVPVRAWPNNLTVCAMYIAPGRPQNGLWPLWYIKTRKGCRGGRDYTGGGKTLHAYFVFILLICRRCTYY